MTLWLGIGAVALVVIFAIVAALESWRLRVEARQIEVLANLACQKCGKPFGKVTAEAARAAFMAGLHAFQAKHPDKKIRYQRAWPFACPHCGEEWRFMYEKGTLRDEVRSPEPEEG